MPEFLGDYTAEFRRGRGPDKQPRKRRLARNLAIAGGGTVGTVVAARYGLKGGGRAIGKAIETASRESARRASKGATMGAAIGAKEGAAAAKSVVGSVPKGAQKAANAARKKVVEVASTPANTRKAFKEGLDAPGGDTWLKKAARRGGRDAGKTRRWIKKTTGFSRYS